MVTYGQVPERDSEALGGRFLRCHGAGSSWHLVARSREGSRVASREGSMPRPSLHLISAGTELVTAALAPSRFWQWPGMCTLPASPCSQWGLPGLPAAGWAGLSNGREGREGVLQHPLREGREGVLHHPCQCTLPTPSRQYGSDKLSLSCMLPPSKRSPRAYHQPGHCTQPYTAHQSLHGPSGLI